MTYSHQKGYSEKNRQEKALKLPPIYQGSELMDEKRTVNLGYTSVASSRTQNHDLISKREDTLLSQESTRSKIIYKWHLW